MHHSLDIQDKLDLIQNFNKRTARRNYFSIAELSDNLLVHPARLLTFWKMNEFDELKLLIPKMSSLFIGRQ